jgi:hypothetical protein
LHRRRQLSINSTARSRFRFCAYIPTNINPTSNATCDGSGTASGMKLPSGLSPLM